MLQEQEKGGRRKEEEEGGKDETVTNEEPAEPRRLSQFPIRIHLTCQSPVSTVAE